MLILFGKFIHEKKKKSKKRLWDGKRSGKIFEIRRIIFLDNRKNRKIVKYRTFSFFNIGTVLFGIIFVYMIICLILYLTTDHITAYEVTAGPLSGNYRYNALALRTEEVVRANQTGNITYYTREGSKVSLGSAVCSISEGRSVTSLTPEKVSGGTVVTDKVSSLDDEALKTLKDEMITFSLSFQEESFQNVYNFKGDLESTIMEISSGTNFQIADGSYIVNGCTAPTEGIVVLSTDGYETKTPETVTADDFEQKNYEKENLRMKKSVKSGEPIFKLVTEETWYLCIPLDQKMVTELADRTSVKFRFLKDDTTFYADFAIQKKGNSYIGILTMDKCMSRFASERYVDIELMLSRKTGLKIPNSAIVRKNFYKIPEEFAIYDREQSDSPSQIRVMYETTDKDGNIVNSQKTATVYDKVEDGFLVDCSLFEVGDVIRRLDTTKTYTISDTEILNGVYNINRGYAEFREITIIDENEEYCIVEEGSAFGLAQYDHIVLNADTVNDEDIVIHY